MDFALLGLLAVLLVFMFWSSRRRMQKQKAEQAQRAEQTVPGAEVLLQGGLYGTIVSYDPENLDQPAIVELAPGVEIKVHSQAILRVVTPTEDVDDEDEIDDEDDETAVEEISEDQITEEVNGVVIPDDASQITGDSTDEPGSKPQA